MIGFPLLLIPLAIVNIAVFLMGLGLDRLQEPVVQVGLPSLQPWTITFSDVLLSLGLLLLFVEVVKSARPGAKYFTDHFLSMLVFVAAAAEFLLLPQFANSTFFLLTLMALVDVIAGISIRAVRPKFIAQRTAPPVTEPPVADPVAPPVERTMRTAPVEVKPAPPPVMVDSERVPPLAGDAVPVTDPVPGPKTVTGESVIVSEPKDAPMAPHQEILPPEPTTVPRR